MNDVLSGYVGSMGGLALLTFFLPALVDSPIGYMLIGASTLFALLAVIVGVRHGRSAVTLIALVIVLGVLVWGVIYGIFWTFVINMAGQPLLNLGE